MNLAGKEGNRAVAVAASGGGTTRVLFCYDYFRHSEEVIAGDHCSIIEQGMLVDMIMKILLHATNIP